MIQKITLRNEENPLEETIIEVDVEGRDKILSSELYTKDLYAMYCNNKFNKTDIADITNNSIVKGHIVNINDTHATVELNRKYSTTIELSKEKKEYTDYIQQDKILDLKVNRLHDQFIVSFSNAVYDIKQKEIINSIDQKVAYLAHVDELTNGGYFLTIDTVKVFMPGSLAGMNKLSNFEELIGKDIYVVAINYSTQFNLAVVSHREYLHTLKPEELDKVKYDVLYNGKITGCSKYGIFAEFNTINDLNQPCVLTGLIPTSEMDSTTLELFNSGNYKAGGLIDFYVKNIVNENKIILTKLFVDWDKTFMEYKQDKEVNCTIIKIQDNIIFGTLDNTKLIGTITNYDNTCNVGDIIKLKISKIDINSKKIFLKI